MLFNFLLFSRTFLALRHDKKKKLNYDLARLVDDHFIMLVPP